MSFDENGEKFRRVAQGKHGPLYVEKTVPPDTGRPARRWVTSVLRFLFGLIRAGLLIVGAVYAAMAVQEHEPMWLIPGGLALTLFAFLVPWPYWAYETGQ